MPYNVIMKGVCLFMNYSDIQAIFSAVVVISFIIYLSYWHKKLKKENAELKKSLDEFEHQIRELNDKSK